MFDKLKQLGELGKLRSQASQMQKKMQQIVVSEEEGDVKVKVLGTGEIDYLEVSGQVRDDLKRLINKAIKNAQKESAKKMFEEGGGLGGLLGKLT
jgi:DNA-binding protein YbaB